MKPIFHLGLVLATALRAFAADSLNDAKAVQGSWVPTAAELAGQPMAQAVSAVESSSPRIRATRSGGQVRSPTGASERTGGCYWSEGTPAARLRSMPATVCPVVIGSSGWVSVPSTRA